MTENHQFERRVIEFFDTEFYKATYPDVERSGVRPLEHYLKLGAREGRRPNRWYTDQLVPASVRNKYPGVPLVVLFLTELPGLDEERFRALCRNNAFADAGHADCWACDKMRGEFDGSFYRVTHPDLSLIEDALAHYCERGWQEQRHPCKDFDADYYLAVNDDVRSAGINPFVHYLSVGKDEGRKPAPEDPVARKQLLALQTFPEATRCLSQAPVNLMPASASRLAADLLQRAAAGAGMCISFSHDDYLRHTGGVQKFVADESRYAEEAGYPYIHMCPAIPGLQLVEGGAMGSLLVNCTVAGVFAGTFTAAELASTLEWVESKHPGALKVCTIHSMMGWRTDAVAAISRLFAQRFFYVHDYFALCGEYRLLRNNVQACGAPAPESAQCRICVHGDQRVAHLARVEQFFAAVNPTLVFPSAAAQAQFRQSGLYPDLAGIVVPHIEVEQAPATGPRKLRPAGDIRVAYCGAAAAHKGFFHFEQIVRECAGAKGLAFHHFGSEDGRVPNVEYVPVALKDGRSRLTDMLRAYDIDIVFVGSVWAETFNFIAYEAAQAGAAVITLDGAGNVADFVDQFDVGCHLGDWQAVASMLKSDELFASLSRWQSNAARLRLRPNRSVMSKGVLDEKQTLLLHLIQ